MSTRTNAETTAWSSSMIGRVRLSSGTASLRNSLNRVKPQSISSAVKRWCAWLVEKSVGSVGFEITSANCAHACQPSGVSWLSA